MYFFGGYPPTLKKYAINISSQFSNKFHKTISKKTINNSLLEKLGKPYRGVNSIILTEDHIAQNYYYYSMK